MRPEDIQTLLAEHLPYFDIRRSEDGTRWHFLYNGQIILAEHWGLFEQFTSAIGFPLDFSSSLYVGVSVSHEDLIAGLALLTPSKSSD